MLAPSLTNAFHNFKCGEIYCISSAVYNVTCCLCATKMELDNFTSHFLVHHLTLAEEGIILEKEGSVKEEDPEDDPIKQEKLVNEDDKTLEQLIRETENESLLTEVKDLNKGEREIKLMADKSIPFQNDKLLFPCFICKRSYRSKNSFYNHKSKVHNLKKSPKNTKLPKAEHKCEECNWSFRWARDLRSHKCKHYGIYAKNFKKLQSKTAAFLVEQEQKVDLLAKEQNINITSKENEIICNELKEYEDDNNMDRDSAMEDNFLKSESVTRRKRNLQNDKLLFPCLICKRSYRSKNSFYNHKSKVHNLKKPLKKTRLPKVEHKCQECHESFRSDCDLRGHKCKATDIFATNSKKIQIKAVTSLVRQEENVDLLANEQEEQNNITSKVNEIICNELEEELEGYEGDDNDMDRDWSMEDNCSKSKSVTRDKRNLQNDKLLFPCLICKRSYRSKNSYYNHKSKVHNLNKAHKKTKLHKAEHKCEKCNERFRSDPDLRDHRCKHSSLVQHGEEVDLSAREHEEQNNITSRENEINCNELKEELEEYKDDNNDMDRDWSMEDNCSKKKSVTRGEKKLLNDKLLFPCHICKRSYRSKNSYYNHKSKVHNLKISLKKNKLPKTEHKCGECNENFCSACDLRDHNCKYTAAAFIVQQEEKVDLLVKEDDESTITETSKENEIICDELEKELKEYEDDNNDMDKDWSMEDKWSESESNTKDTNNIPKDEKIFPCLICNRSYRSKHSFSNHKRRVHTPKTELPNTEHKCNECNETFSSARNLRGHMWKHTGIFCDICGKSFAQPSNLNRHKIRHTGIKAHKCKECGKEFFTDKELKAHMISHTGLRSVICEICGKQCRDRGLLTAHMRRHTGERPAKCEVCCKSFYSFHDLNMHAVTHTSERPFKCDICDSTFQRKKSLRIHKLIHLKDRKHVCKICGKGFTLSSGLNSHMRTHDAALEKATTKTTNFLISATT